MVQKVSDSRPAGLYNGTKPLFPRAPRQPRLMRKPWSGARSVARGVNKEGHHASIPNQPCPPPRPIGRACPLVPRQFWLTLTVETRERILAALSRIVAQQLAVPPAIQEATDDRH